jgi:DNA-binding transcriptional MerR regulator
MLRNWERNGLLTVPRDPDNGYRRYGPAEIGRLRVIRTLRHARYSPMAILRMLRQLDADRDANLRQALDTPDPEKTTWAPPPTAGSPRWQAWNRAPPTSSRSWKR